MLRSMIKYSLLVSGWERSQRSNQPSEQTRIFRASQEKSCGAFLFSKAWVSTDLSPCAYGWIRNDKKQKCWQCEPHITTSDLIPSGIRKGLSTVQTNTQPIDSAQRIKSVRNKRQCIRGAVQGHEPKASPSNFPSLRILLESKQLSF